MLKLTVYGVNFAQYHFHYANTSLMNSKHFNPKIYFKKIKKTKT